MAAFEGVFSGFLHDFCRHCCLRFVFQSSFNLDSWPIHIDILILFEWLCATTFFRVAFNVFFVKGFLFSSSCNWDSYFLLVLQYPFLLTVCNALYKAFAKAFLGAFLKAFLSAHLSTWTLGPFTRLSFFSVAVFKGFLNVFFYKGFLKAFCSAHLSTGTLGPFTSVPFFDGYV